MRPAHFAGVTVTVLLAVLMILPGTALLGGRGPPEPMVGEPQSGAAPRIEPTPTTAVSEGFHAPEASGSPTSPVPLTSLPSNCLQTGSPVSGHITPCLLTTPVPMGLSDFGVAGGAGAYAYATPSFTTNVTILRPFSAFSPGYAEFDDAPNWVRVSLDTVAVNATYPHEAAPGTFWVENGVVFNGSALTVEDNVWNFSAESVPVKVGTLNGSIGTLQDSEYYGGVGPSFAVASAGDFPLYLHLTTSIANVSGHVKVELNYSLTENKTLAGSGTYDNVTFGGLALSADPPSFLVDGKLYNPGGLLYDAEVDVGGTSDGANANIQELNASVHLQWWNKTALKFETIRSAYDFGVDSAETALGVAAYYVNTTGNRTEYLGQGPSILYGLWNTTSGPFVPSVAMGWTRLTVQVQPAYAFLFETNFTGFHAETRLANFSWVPTTPTGVATMFLPPLGAGGAYIFEAWADGFDNSTTTPTNTTAFITDNTSVSKTITLTAAPTVENAPVYLDGDSQVGAFGGARVQQTGYSVSAKTLWLNASTVTLAPPFLRLNDYSYPTFVLVAAENLSYSVLVNGLVQSSSTFTFTKYANESDYLPGWTQGYFFFGGTASADSVASATVAGVSSLFHDLNPTYPPATVECYRTPACEAQSITASLDAIGVTAIHVRAAALASLTGENGGIAALVENSGNVTVQGVAATGADGTFFSGGLELLNDTNVTVDSASASLLAWGIMAYGTKGLTVSGLTATKNSPGFYLNFTNSSTVENVAVDSQSFAGAWANSTDLRLTDLVCAGTGAEFNHDTAVTVVGASAVGTLVSAIAEFNHSSGDLSYINATDDATGVNATNATNVVLADINASDGSVGANLSNVSDLTATVLSATNTSVALSWGPTINVTTGKISASGGTTGTISDVYVASGPASARTSGSVGLNISNVTGLTISNVTAVGVPGLASVMTLPSDLVTYPVTALNLTNDTNVQIHNVSTTYYPYGVRASRIATLGVDGLEAWYGNVSLTLNNTSSVTLTHLFTYGSEIGAELINNQSGVSLGSSTFEGSVLQGLNVSYNNYSSVSLSVTGNNFIATNGSSETGQYSAAHAQVSVTNASRTLTFSGNYFSDHSGGGGYAIPNGTHDPTPSSTVLETWLAFEESGLPSRTNWSFRYGGETYFAVVPTVYIPGWTLGARPGPFTVASAGGLKPSPASGSVSWSGTNQTVHIQFGTGLPFGLSLFELVALVGGIIAAVVAVILWRVLRKPSPRPEDPDAAVRPQRPQPTPPSGDRHQRRYEP
jgi:hypothetical protein